MRMRRVSLLCTAAMSAALAAPASLVPSAAGAPGLRDASVRVVACRADVAQAGRYLTVEGAMRSLAAGDRLQMRFELQRRARGLLRFVRVGGPGLSTYTEAARGVTRYRYRRKIENLPAPAQYRVVVSFRWLNAAGRVTARTHRTSAICSQPDLRPDLRVGVLIGRERIAPERTRYTLTVVNAGRSPVRDFDVVLSVGGVAQPAQTVVNLAPGEHRTVTVTGPRCTGTGLAVVLDSDDRVDEALEGNNTRSAVC
ncbi:MAG: CARDB domain-containing protein [Solirubrobacteraceae bacterium]